MKDDQKEPGTALRHADLLPASCAMQKPWPDRPWPSARGQGAASMAIDPRQQPQGGGRDKWEWPAPRRKAGRRRSRGRWRRR